MAKMVRLAIDFENTARGWWDAGGRALWEGVSEGFDTNAVLIDEALALSWLEEAARIPGWNDGHEFAPHPVLIRELDPDEEV